VAELILRAKGRWGSDSDVVNKQATMMEERLLEKMLHETEDE
jgi:hypothetical protein